ncbi:MAG: hypothetical protein WBM50_17565 [Acidimicrobiales bacterium]
MLHRSFQRTVEPRRRRPLRTLSILAGVLLVLGLVAGCGDDPDPEAAFCDAGDSLRSNIDGLGEVDIVSGGTDALSAQFDAISADVEALRDAGSEVAAGEIEALDSATVELETVIGSLGDESTVSDAVNAVDNVITSARAVLDRLATTCE